MIYPTLSTRETFDDPFGDLMELPDTLESCFLEDEDLQAAAEYTAEWSTYTQALAILGFYRWLGDREPTLTRPDDPLSLLDPLYSKHLNAIFHLRVNGFEVCLLPCLSWSEDTIAIPRVVVELAQFTDGFYAIAALDESLEAIAIKGFLNYQELSALTTDLAPASDWNYYLHIDDFHHNLDTLLLNLQCLAPEAIERLEPTETPVPSEHISSLRAKLPPIKESDRPLWQQLTWEESLPLWSHRELLQWLESDADGDDRKSQTHLSDLLQLLLQPAIDVTNWLWDRAEELGGWQLIPATAFRRHLPLSPAADVNTLLAEIDRETGVTVPKNAGRAYQDLNLGLGVRLYAITWCLSYEDSWTLLLILGTRSGPDLAAELGWRISDQSGILVEESISVHRSNSYLFAQAIGTYDEKFLVTLFSGTDSVMSLPPFSFPWGN